MKVSIKLLTTYRKKLPEGIKGNTCTLEFPDRISVAEVLAYFDIPYDSSSVVLVNGQSPESNQRLTEGDEVCVYSAMAGG